MKKVIITLALALTVGLAGISMAQTGWGNGGGWCNGPGGWNNVSYEEMEQFRNDTAELREKMFELRQEYYEAMSQEDPDKDRQGQWRHQWIAAVEGVAHGVIDKLDDHFGKIDEA